jgi:hypothetical protein
MLAIVAVALLLIATTTRPAGASVRFGFDLIAPPVLVPIPSSPVRYAPSVDANYFFYGGGYYVYADDVWYTAGAYNGPWVVVAPEFVPLPLLGVPVGFFRFRPHGWEAWRHDRPPHWGGAYAHHAHERWEGEHHAMGHGMHHGHRG